MVYNDEVFTEKELILFCRTCSLIFKNKVIANGDLDNPIVFEVKIMTIGYISFIRKTN